MKIIIPMAGKGSRLRPHTLTVPKPLLPIAGKPMVQRLVEDLSASLQDKIEEIAFVIGAFGPETEQKLHEVAAAMGARCAIYYQDEPLGVGHAISCARNSLEGNCIIAFSDTLFKADFAFDPASEGVIWLQKVADPSSFGVVLQDENGLITGFIEKPTTFVSDLAIVGIYYLRQADRLRDALDEMMANNIKDKGEFQLTTALEMLRDRGLAFRPAYIEEWLDCGNKDNMLHTNRRMLELKQQQETLISPSAQVENAIILPPCYIGDNSVVRNSVVGPYVSVGSNSSIAHSVISNSIIQNETNIQNANLMHSMIGNSVDYQGESSKLSLGDYSKV
jgi:glucose-1-phosphate thymidylyltransferase